MLGTAMLKMPMMETGDGGDCDVGDCDVEDGDAEYGGDCDEKAKMETAMAETATRRQRWRLRWRRLR